MTQTLDTHSRELERRFGLTLPQLDVIWAVANHGSAPVGRIAAQVHLSKATLTSIADRLVDHGLLMRERSETDKRQVMISITEKARAILEQRPHPFADEFSTRLNELEHWQQTELLSSLQKIASLMEPAHREEEPSEADADATDAVKKHA
ncbi:MAG: MarR family winged helix-turn-helix transcriptional regulator [Spirochaetales bacterium]